MSDNKFCIRAILSFETVDETRGMKSHGVTNQIKPLADRAIYFCELKHDHSTYANISDNDKKSVRQRHTETQRGHENVGVFKGWAVFSREGSNLMAGIFK